MSYERSLPQTLIGESILDRIMREYSWTNKPAPNDDKEYQKLLDRFRNKNINYDN
jgi:hypothetical protein